MNIFDLTESQIFTYFQGFFPAIKLVGQQMLKCPFHEDKTASLSVNLQKGIWSCKAGCGQGGLINFEIKRNGGDNKSAYAAICQTVGIPRPATRPDPLAVYSYRDAGGREIFQKLRYPGKSFVLRHLGGNGEWVYKLPASPKPLYNLPDVITASLVIVVEGEKDADNVRNANLGQYDDVRVAITTNFEGSSTWDSRNSPYFAGKTVIILPDNDAPGKRHAQQIAESIYGYAHAVFIRELPALPEKGDVSDFLLAYDGEHLWEALKTRVPWAPVKSELLIPVHDFLGEKSAEIDWLVHGVIQRGANGFFAAPPKGSKSWLAMDLAIAVASGQPWLGLETAKAKVAFISREDHPNLTRWRADHLIRGRGLHQGDLPIWMNTKDQSPQYKLDNPTQLTEMLEALKIVKPELIILDVFNMLHGAEENDNTDMRKIMDCLDIMHRETRASICMLHHFNKMATGRITERLRGSSGIAGWAEWIVGIEYATDKQDEKARIAQFDVKAAPASEPVCFVIKTENEQSKIEIVNKPLKGKKNRVSEIMEEKHAHIGKIEQEKELIGI